MPFAVRQPRRSSRPAPARLSITHDTHGVAWIVRVAGPVHAADRHDLRVQLELAEMVHAPLVVLDLADATFVSVAALGELVSFRHRLGARGGCVTLVTRDPMFRGLLAQLRLDQPFDLASSVEEAEAAEGTTLCGRA